VKKGASFYRAVVLSRTGLAHRPCGTVSHHPIIKVRILSQMQVDANVLEGAVGVAEHSLSVSW